MTKMAININGMLAKTDLNKLNILLGQEKILSNISNTSDWNNAFYEIFMESIYCRAIDIFHDCLFKHVCEVIAVLELTDSKLTYGIKNEDKVNLFKSENPKESVQKHLISLLSFQLKKLRRFAKNLGLAITPEIETIVVTRNYIVHRNGLVDEKYIDFVTSAQGCNRPAVKENKICLSPKFTKWSIDFISETITKNEDILNKEYSVDWFYIDSSSLGKPIKINKWTKQFLPSYFSGQLMKLFYEFF